MWRRRRRLFGQDFGKSYCNRWVLLRLHHPDRPRELLSVQEEGGGARLSAFQSRMRIGQTRQLTGRREGCSHLASTPQDSERSAVCVVRRQLGRRCSGSGRPKLPRVTPRGGL